MKTKYYGPDKPVREKLKEAGRRLQSDEQPIDKRLIGYGLEAYGHYYRSLEAAINNNRAHPKTFSDYFAHWLHSDPSHVHTSLFNILGSLFPKPKILRIKCGGTYWKKQTLSKV